VPQTDSPDQGLLHASILFGEDDEDDRDMLLEVFSSLEIKSLLSFVNNGKEIVPALEKLMDKQLPSLIVLDYNMPELNGADILKELNQFERYRRIPKIVWSTSGSEKFRQTCLDSGAADYIIKPSTHEELGKIARYMLSFSRGIRG
jgi:CheY-like chemotaxis protein